MIRPVNLTWTTARSLADVRDWVTSSVATTLRKAGYRVTVSTPDELVMTHAGSSNWWLLLISWMAFWLSDTRSYQVTFKFVALADGRSRVLIIGELPSKVAAVLEDLVAPARH